MKVVRISIWTLFNKMWLVVNGNGGVDEDQPLKGYSKGVNPSNLTSMCPWALKEWLSLTIFSRRFLLNRHLPSFLTMIGLSNKL